MEYVIGIDGGGTSTTAVAIDREGRQIAHAEGQASNPKSSSGTDYRTNIHNVISQLLNDSSLALEQCCGVGAGIAGVYTPKECEAGEQLLRSYWHERRQQVPNILVVSDAETALAAAFGTNRGIVAIAGTGSIVLGILPSGERVRAGGWGHILGDRGSGYAIGQRTLQTVMLGYDGIVAVTELSDKVLHHYDARSAEELRYIMYQPQMGKRQIAAAAKLCIEASQSGDVLAQQIIMQAASDMAEFVQVLLNRYPQLEQTGIAATGSIFRHSVLYRETFIQQLQQNHTNLPEIRLAEQEAAYGAAILIMNKLAKHPHVWTQGGQ